MSEANTSGGAQIGLVGLAVMGQNLAYNIAEKGFRIAVTNRSPERVEETERKAGPLADRMIFARTYQDFVAALPAPRTVILMVQAGKGVDESIAALLPLLTPGDCIVDAGNSNFRDSLRRERELAAQGFAYLGVGVSGGEEGARHGPSIMAGGTEAAYRRVEPILTAISAKYQGADCAAYVGPGGAGHFVKTIHNGIEYADMEMIAEIYGLMKNGLGMPLPAIADAFEAWKSGPLDSYLIDITVDVLRARDTAAGTGGGALLDAIVDSAGQKGTGRWSVIEAIELAVPASAIAAAVDARVTSAARALRATMHGAYGSLARPLDLPAGAETLKALEQTLIAGKVLAYAQGFAVLAEESARDGTHLPLATIARIWRAGCIIRSRFLDRIASAYDADPALATILLDPDMKALVVEALPGARRVLAAALTGGHPTPALSAGVNYLLAMTQPRSTADLIQGQRDFFGAHGFERLDRPGTFHGPWAH
ncbi:MAG TPA: NADP-dependent phosphogluconate dehydrogenase [Xanthobacteraceae bacterium]|nr:NADP-dependent phosphogluconate dehydrogenase [Xanthobacteraceae bacterium]